MNQKASIVVFEHEKIRFDVGEKRITEDQFHALEKFYGSGVPYYSLCYHGIQFNEFVGVLQVGKTVIEVLPKADKEFVNQESEKNWRDLLIGMLRAVSSFDIHSTSESSLRIKPNSILDLYVELYILELESLVHSGLVKKYRRTQGISTALIGSLNFPKHLQHSVVHKERFFINFTTYDNDHLLHQIFFKALKFINQYNVNLALDSRIGNLLLNFPEVADVKVDHKLFERIFLNRKTAKYKNALEIAKLLLLQYHPDLSGGKNNVLALMFDMNLLWEKFILISLKKNLSQYPGIIVKGQDSTVFWKPSRGYDRIVKPDIVIEKGPKNFVLDTKWKLIKGKPTIEDIKQMFVYHQYFDANKAALVFPGNFEDLSGDFEKPTKTSIGEWNYSCSLMFFPLDFSIIKWQAIISDRVLKWMEE